MAHAFASLRRNLGTAPSSDHFLPPDLSPADLQRCYERVLDHTLSSVDDEPAFEKTAGRRKASGSYFTPDQLATPLIDATVTAALNARIARNVFSVDDPVKAPPMFLWSRSERDRASDEILAFKICDPTCGPGVFLTAVAARLAGYLFQIRSANDAEVQPGAYLRDVLLSCVYGVDSDPLAVALARLALWLLADRPPGPLSRTAPHLRCRDSLAVAVDGGTASRPEPMQWEQEFPEVFKNGGFDVVVGNPPFANAIEGGVDAFTKEFLTDEYRELGGTSDLAYYFLALGDRLARPDGAVGFVLPRGVLTSRATEKLRARLLEERPPALIYAPQNPYLFPGANVFVVALALRRGAKCLGGRDPDQPRLSAVTVHDVNWWAPLIDESPTPPRARKRVADRFEVFASMTTGMAYDLLAAVTDEPVKDGLRLVTTGLIDPGVCYWGQRVCRYLKQRFEHPSINHLVELPAYLASRLEKVRRPKILVAGLSTRVEAFLDEKGIYCGAISTYTIVHPNDDVLSLRQLCEHLNSKQASKLLQVQLGAHAMGGGRITLTKNFLQQLPLP